MSRLQHRRAPTRVVIVENHQLVSDSLSALLDDQQDMMVVLGGGAAETGWAVTNAAVTVVAATRIAPQRGLSPSFTLVIVET
ncbi:MAG TPA: hypothetical protein VJQ08_07830 [Candidatus Dormibacteraeota bacterium]|nr:hypothetical protein [Candidatus Dormibacteraeota bacterium]